MKGVDSFAWLLVYLEGVHRREGCKVLVIDCRERSGRGGVPSGT